MFSIQLLRSQLRYLQCLLLCLCLALTEARAQPNLLQGAYLQLQQLVQPKESKDNQQESVTQEELLRLLKDDNAQIEQGIRGLHKEQSALKERPASRPLPKKSDALAKLMDDSQAELDQWQDKKALSESVSLELSRERVHWQQALKQLSEGGSAQAGQRELLEHRLHNVALKMRFAETFQELAQQQILWLSQHLQELESKLTPPQQVIPQATEHSDNDADTFQPLPDTRQLQQRLSQARKDLIQLQNLLFEVKYQLPEVHRMETFYQLMLKQKQRLQAIPVEQSARQLQQTLRLKRYLLLEEKASQENSEPMERRQAIEREQDLLEQQIQRVRELELLESELSQKQQEMILLLEQRQLWTATAPALSPAGIATLPGSVVRQLSLSLQKVGDFIIYTGFWWLTLLPVFWLYRRLGKLLVCWRREFNGPADLSLTDWLKQLVMLVCRSILLLLSVWVLGQSVSQWAELSQLLVMTGSWLLLLDVFKRKGLVDDLLISGINIFPWNWSLMLSSLAGLWLTVWSLSWFDNPFENRTAQLFLMTCSLWQLLQVWFWRNHFVSGDWRGMALKISWLFSLFLALLASCLGYISLSWLIFRDTQWLLLGAGLLCLLYLLAEQGLKVRASRLVIRKALQMKQDQAEQATSHEALKSSRKMIHAMEKQGRVILNLFFSLLGLLVVVLLWQDISPMLSPVSETRLLTFSREQGVLSLALGSVFSFFTVLFFTWLIAANLPGLVMMLIPATLGQNPGSTYILKRLLVYTIWAVGITLSLGQIGLPWEKLQWVVLAISVGAGLGLQDVVANFVSGLIILIERPIRVGDTITINNIEGIVRQIRVRATVIEVVDRREFIVPNKALTTGQFTNWSLSSNTLRIQLWYGVEHGSDNNLVLMILLKAAENSPLVMKTPQSEAAFIECNEHCDRYELRIFVHVDDRFQVKNQVNQRVKELFQEYGVELAHWQHDLNIVQMPEAEIRKKDRSGG